MGSHPGIIIYAMSQYTHTRGGVHCRKRNQWPELKFVFHFELIPLGKAWIHLFFSSSYEWIRDYIGFFSLAQTTNLRKGKLWIQTTFTQLKNSKVGSAIPYSYQMYPHVANKEIVSKVVSSKSHKPPWTNWPHQLAITSMVNIVYPLDHDR